MKGARIFGVVGGEANSPKVDYLSKEVPLTSVDIPTPLKPTEVFRLAATCESGCAHFDAQDLNRCRLAAQVVQILPAVTATLPACVIRAECRWFGQEREQACVRCPQVVTQNYNASLEYSRAVSVPLE
jgi:hypothetical protein